MKLRKLHIKNFRAFKDATIHFDNYTCFVGPNGSGKSTVLAALNVFFQNPAAATDVTNLSDEDFHFKNTAEPIEITVTFDNLSEEAAKDLKDYYRQQQLVVSARATWDENSGSALVEQHGQRRVMTAFARYFEAKKEGVKVVDLRPIYQTIRDGYPNLPDATTGTAMEAALRKYEAENSDECEQLSSPDKFYGVQGAGRLGPHLQWVYVPAVKDASSEQAESRATALGQLLQRTIRAKLDFPSLLEPIRNDAHAKYEEFLREQQSQLDDLSESLQGRLRHWSHPESSLRLEWQPESVSIREPSAKVFAGERGFQGELARLGHGMQRSFLVAILQELASSTGEDSGPTLLLAVEEPELYQHPPQARHFAGALETLVSDNAQTIVTTHSPYFISGKGFEAIRMVRASKKLGAAVKRMTAEQLTERLNEALGGKLSLPSSVMARLEPILQPSQAELFFSDVPVLVEGLEDVAFISAHLNLTDRWEEFRRLRCHFVVSQGKRNLSRLAAVSKGLSISSFLIFDADRSNQTTDNERDNLCLLRLFDHDTEVPFPTEIVWESDMIVWPEDLRASVIADIGQSAWSQAVESARAKHELPTDVDKKNSILIAAALEEHARNGGSCDLLARVCDQILAHAAAALEISA